MSSPHRYLPGTTIKNPKHTAPGVDHVQQETAKERRARLHTEAVARHEVYEKRTDQEHYEFLFSNGAGDCAEANRLYKKIQQAEKATDQKAA